MFNPDAGNTIAYTLLVVFAVGLFVFFSAIAYLFIDEIIIMERAKRK